MGSVVSYLDYVYMENPEGQFVKEGLLQVQRSVVGVRLRTLEKKIRTPLGEVSLTVITVMQDGPTSV